MAYIQGTLDPVKQANFFLVLVLLLSHSGLALAATTLLKSSLEEGLTALVQLIENDKIQIAIETSESLLDEYPGSNAVQLIYADLRNMLAHNDVSMAPTENYSQQLIKTLNELTARLKHPLSEPSRLEIPENFLQVRTNTRHIIAVDLGKSRLYLLERDTSTGAFQLREHHYVSIGLGGSGKRHEGDLRTPIGIYDIDGFKPDNKLPKLYGSGAFTLNYPNPLDKLAGRTGSGIWLHGMPHEQLSRPPQDSEGCVVVQNELIRHLKSLIDRSTTPVLLSDSLHWLQTNAIDTSALSDLQSAISLQYASNNKAELEEALLLPKGSPGPENGLVYRVRFLLEDYSEPNSSSQVNTQYWWKNTDGRWSLLSEEA